MSLIRSIRFEDSPNIDSFSCLRISEKRPVADYNPTYTLLPLNFEQITSGTGNTVSLEANTLMTKLDIGGTAVGHSRIQTYMHHYYQPGVCRLVYITCVLGAPVANTIKRVGYFGDGNGVFLQQDADGTLRFVLRTSTSGSVSDANTVDVTEWSEKPDWVIDPEKSLILAFDLQFLGMGRVRCYEDRDGELVHLHSFLNEQNLSVPYMQTATLPVRAEIIQTTTAAPATMHFKCASVMNEGGTEAVAGLSFAQDSGSITAASGARTHALSLQPATTFGGITNRTTIELDSVDVLVTGNNPVKWELCIGDVITGTTTFNAVNSTYSSMQYNTAGTTSGAPAIIIASGYVAASNQAKQAIERKLITRYPITLDAAGAVRANGRLTVLVTGIGGSSACQATLNWREIR